MLPRIDVIPHALVSLLLVVGVACAHQPSNASASETPRSCHECTTVSGRVVSLSGEPILSAKVLPVPRAAAPTAGQDSLVAVDAEGQFLVTLTGFGARPLMFGADGFVPTGTMLHADGSDVELEVRLAPKNDPGGQSAVSYRGPMNDTRRLGELQDGPLCWPPRV